VVSENYTLDFELRDARWKKKSLFHVSDATIAIVAGCHGCGGTNPRRLCALYSLVAFAINKNRITSNYSTISCRNSPRRQLKFAIGHNSSLIAILHIHPSAFNAHRLCISINHLSNGLYLQYKYFYFVMQACLPRQDRQTGTTKDFGAIKRVASAKRSQGGRVLGRREGHTGVLGCRAGLRAVLRRASAAKREQALAFADLVRGLGSWGWGPLMLRTCAVRWV
jgi:hypothetical protein